MSSLYAELQHLRWRLEQTEKARDEATEALRECRQELEDERQERTSLEERHINFLKTYLQKAQEGGEDEG